MAGNEIFSHGSISIEVLSRQDKIRSGKIFAERIFLFGEVSYIHFVYISICN
jgi:hypothetical protein